MAVRKGVVVIKSIEESLNSIDRPIEKDIVPALIVKLLQVIDGQEEQYKVPATGTVFSWLVTEVARAEDLDERNLLHFVALSFSRALYVGADARQ